MNSRSKSTPREQQAMCHRYILNQQEQKSLIPGKQKTINTKRHKIVEDNLKQNENSQSLLKVSTKTSSKVNKEEMEIEW